MRFAAILLLLASASAAELHTAGARKDLGHPKPTLAQQRKQKAAKSLAQMDFFNKAGPRKGFAHLSLSQVQKGSPLDEFML